MEVWLFSSEHHHHMRNFMNFPVGIDDTQGTGWDFLHGLGNSGGISWSSLHGSPHPGPRTVFVQQILRWAQQDHTEWGNSCGFDGIPCFFDEISWEFWENVTVGLVLQWWNHPRPGVSQFPDKTFLANVGFLNHLSKFQYQKLST